MLRTHEKDQPIAAQLVGACPEKMLKATEQLLKLTNVPFIDINCGCPVRKVVSKQAGSALLKHPEIITQMIRGVVRNFDIPVTIKMRAGFEEINYNYIADYAKRCENAGTSAIFVHGRTQKAGYHGNIDFNAIKAVKDAVSIPVFGSGNIFDHLSAKNMLDKTGCDGLLVARGAFGNPWIFADIEEYLTNKKIPQSKTLTEKLNALKKHLAYIKQYNPFNPLGKMGYMRKIAQWYIHDFNGAREIRNTVSYIKTYDELIALISSILAAHRNN